MNVLAESRMSIQSPTFVTSHFLYLSVRVWSWCVVTGAPIWLGAPDVCGFSTGVATRRISMSLEVYIDESGKGDPPVFVLAGFIARADQWTAFNEEWIAALSEVPAVAAFHMTDARWSGNDVKLPRLLDIIRRHVLVGIAISVLHADYETEIRGKIAKRLDHPYSMVFYSIFVTAAAWQLEVGLDEKMDFIFDEQRSESDFLELHWPKILSAMPDEIKRRIGGRPIHADDKEIIPLQAADILAWYLRRKFARDMQGEIPETSLASLFRGIKVVHYCPARNHWKQLIANIDKRNVLTGMVTEHQFNELLPQ